MGVNLEGMRPRGRVDRASLNTRKTNPQTILDLEGCVPGLAPFGAGGGICVNFRQLSAVAFALDVGETSGWAVFDISGTLELGAGFGLLAGVDNVFDRAYAYHLNRDNFFDPRRVQINEPGRVFWLRLRWSGEG